MYHSAKLWTPLSLPLSSATSSTCSMFVTGHTQMYVSVRGKVRHSNLYSKSVAVQTPTPVWTVSSARSHQLQGFVSCKWCSTCLSSAHTTISLSIQSLRLCRHSWEHHHQPLKSYWGLRGNQTLTLGWGWLSPFLTLQCPLWLPWGRVVTTPKLRKQPWVSFCVWNTFQNAVLVIRATRPIWQRRIFSHLHLNKTPKSAGFLPAFFPGDGIPSASLNIELAYTITWEYFRPYSLIIYIRSEPRDSCMDSSKFHPFPMQTSKTWDPLGLKDRD